MKTERDFLWETIHVYIRDMTSIIYGPMEYNKKEECLAYLNGLAGFLYGARFFAPDWLQSEIDDAEEMFCEIEREVWEAYS